MKNFKEYLVQLPSLPGVYKYFDNTNTIIYVGKAKNLKNRVSSYFTDAKQQTRKTLRLVSNIDRIEFTIVNNELDALLLENSLIKQFQPKYNILLKDDKTYPYICITNESFPKVISTRKFDRKAGTYYGPYSNVKAMNELLEMIRQLYTIRTCNLALTYQNIKDNKFRVCLEYHIKNCKGPCEGLQSETDYLEDIQQIHLILKGNITPIKQLFDERMHRHAQSMEFEKAHEYKRKLELIEIFQQKSLVVNPKITDIMVITIISEEERAFINFLDIQNGSIIHTETFEAEKPLDQTDEDILLTATLLLKEKYQSQAEEVISNIIVNNNEIKELSFSVPQIGDKKKLIDLSLKNVLFAKKEFLKKKEEQREKSLSTTQRVLETLQKDLRLTELPAHIECFDNSNIQGTNPVAAMVCFINGKPSKRNYRHFHIKTVDGPNDFASMHEIVTRRYKRLLEEKHPLPQLIIIDGGKGQLSSAVKALKELNVYGQMAIIGIAKRLEEIYFPDDSVPLYISKKSESLKLIQRIRDEAHRFAITFHRDTRSNNTLHSSLENIEGIGEKTMQKLLQEFKSVVNLQKASLEEIEKIVGKAKANIIYKYLSLNTSK